MMTTTLGCAEQVAQWVEERCIQREGLRADTAELHADYEAWCQRQGITGHNLRAFGRALSGLGLRPQRIRRRNGWAGITVKRADGSEPEPAAPPMWKACRALREFLNTRAVIEPANPGIREHTRTIHTAYAKWAQETGHPAITCRSLGYALGRIGLGLTPVHFGDQRGWAGIMLLESK